jgi:Zn ribbon nucleic-acid-binding protein
MTTKCPICEKSTNIKHWTLEAANNSLHYSECIECGKFKYNLHAFKYIEKLDKNKKKALIHYIKYKNKENIIPDFNFTNYPFEFYDKLVLKDEE